MNIYICVGSSCHLKGSYNIINLMKEALEKNSLSDKVNVSAAFCLGRCTDGVTIKVDDEIITGVSPDNFNDIFDKYVLKGNL
ncbi:(2Fe-2S) ferredoxin domain-containing protein [Anaerofilum sp. BX8]|uniref:(2Fe-2S) ferredoxin domain-containing protein n=1 Tax=Anaerofilum hominis TaxID=2763016 RepID=A0A923I717_9FIRM|nr:(2Fe-2S) ferredoxin domain-containing protein [Anaerofilum hominis]MBC5580137.1 (2Fe-2S) ferredoxin domain-containing protein [Anaerofilum hominis]